MDYFEIRFYNAPELNEILLAWLGDSDFEMFEEKGDGLSAYIRTDHYKEEDLQALLRNIPEAGNIRFEKTFIKDQNWNARWESNFEPVHIAGKVYIRAPFHESLDKGEIEIVIEPKMSFGTGHHATTALMIEQMLDMEFLGKDVLDMGCGSGVLAIFAKMKDAKNVLAIDIDDWAVANSIENCERNRVSTVQVQKGTAEQLFGKRFDIILANINRNVLLMDMETYVSCLDTGGELLMSGFLLEDKGVLHQKAQSLSMQLIGEKSQNNWLSLRFKKQ